MSSVEEALALEYRLTNRLFLSGEFVEGVRALLVDKDKAPKWNPATLEEVSDAQVAALRGGAPLAAGIDHANYQVEISPLPDGVRESLLADLD